MQKRRGRPPTHQSGMLRGNGKALSLGLQHGYFHQKLNLIFKIETTLSHSTDPRGDAVAGVGQLSSAQLNSSVHYTRPCMTTNWCRIIGFPSSSSANQIVQFWPLGSCLAWLAASRCRASFQSVTFDDTARFHSQIIISFILCALFHSRPRPHQVHDHFVCTNELQLIGCPTGGGRK